MLLTKEIKVLKNLTIPYTMVQLEDIFMSYVRDYKIELPLRISKTDIEELDIKKIPKNSNHKIVIVHNKSLLWCPVFQHYYVKTFNPLGLLLTLNVKKHQERYVISFVYNRSKIKTKEYKEIIIVK